MGSDSYRRARARSLRFGFAAALLWLLGCARGPCIAIVAPDGTALATVNVEIANTIEQREHGLMFRKQLDDDAGMIFVFKDSEPRNFWMHNTDIPLDMIFADPQFKVIGIVANAAPNTDTIRTVEGNSQYVLEVNGGFCAKHGIGPGDRFDFQNLYPHASE